MAKNNGEKLVHRIRNEGTEKDLPEGKFCNADLVKSNESASVLDADVTCPDCLKVIEDHKLEAVVGEPKIESIEPIVIHCEHIIGDRKAFTPVVFGQDHEPTLRNPLPAIWIAYGEMSWYLGVTGTRKLRDFCNTVLNDQAADLPGTAKR